KNFFSEEQEEYTLVITRVTTEYEGEYSCTATNRFVQIQPKITPLEINVGSHAKFECEIEDAPSVTFKWYKSGIEIRQSEKYRILSRYTSSSLELLNPVKADSGEYTCKASNQHGTDSCTASPNDFICGQTSCVPVLPYWILTHGSCLAQGQHSHLLRRELCHEM
uniref:Ig-like domain-containing protein n=1 Tax=Lates calcarifer TaxID=8187 RepID=A0A4W6E2M0_LATCA